MEIIKKIEKWMLLRRAKKHYLAFLRIQDRYSCGNALADEITGGKLGHHGNMFNIIMDQLACIDADTPKSRLYPAYNPRA